MIVNLTAIEELVRPLIGDDLLTDGYYVDSYVSSSVFTLPDANATGIISVLVNSSASGVTYTYNNTLQKVTITSSLTVGDTVEFYYNYYCKYSSTQIRNKVKSAVSNLVYRGIVNFSVVGDNIVPEPTYRERQLLAVITGILLEPKNISYVLPDMRIMVPETSVTTDEMINNAISLYNRNVGIFGIIGG